MDNLYSSCPESAGSFSSPSQRSFSTPVSSPRRSTLSSREGPIPFHKYDPPTNRDSYAPYIEQKDGYVDIFTDPRKVEENRMRHSSCSSVSTSRSPNLDDTPFALYNPPDSQEGYIQVLAESDSASGYIDVLPDNLTDSSDHAYLEVLSQEESSHLYIEVLGDENSIAKSSAVSDDHQAYIEVLADDEATNQSPTRGISRGDSDEVYIDVDENRKIYESREQHFVSREQNLESREQHLESGEQHLESREQHLESREQNGDTHYESLKEHSLETHYESSETNHVSHISTHREVYVTHNSVSRDIRHEVRQTRESTASVSSPRWPQSVTCQTSTEFSSLSSESDVFQEREISIVPEVFAEESAKSDDLPTNSETIPKNADVAPTYSDTLPMKSDNPKSEDNSLKSKDYLTLTKPVLPTKPTLVASKSATLPTKSEGLSTDTNVNLIGVNENRNDDSPRLAYPRSAKARSWHNENGSDLAYYSGNSTSTSESEHTRDSHDFSEDDTSDHGEVSPPNQFGSPRDLSGTESRDRSHTEGDLYSLRTNPNGVDPTMLQAFQLSLTNPIQFTPVSSRHPPLTGETAYTQDRIIFELENPIQGISQLPKPGKKSNAVEVKYICSQCGWHKRSKNKPSCRSKQCPICQTPVTKQDAKSPKNKEKDRFWIKLMGKRRSSDDKNDKKDPNFMKPERPSTTPEPYFLKSFRAASEIGLHSPMMEPKRSELGIAPSPLRALTAVSIDGEEARGCVSYDGTSGGKSPLAATLCNGGMANGIASPLRTVSPTLTKTLAPTPPGNYSLGSTKSSPPLCGAGEPGSGASGPDTLAVEGQECEKIARKNSGMTLPTLPEVEDSAYPDYPTCHTPGTPPPMIPPRTRAPPVPPRKRNCPLATPRGESVHKLRRAEIDPTFSLAPTSPQLKAKNRISRTLTDPGNNSSGSSESIRNDVSLGNLLEDGNEELQVTKVVSLSLGDGLDTEAPPPPLPPRRSSGQANQAQPPLLPLPRRASNENERMVNSCDSPRTESRSSTEAARRPLPDMTHESGCPKLPLSAKRSLDMKRADFQARKPIYSTQLHM